MPPPDWACNSRCRHFDEESRLSLPLYRSRPFEAQPKNWATVVKGVKAANKVQRIHRQTSKLMTKGHSPGGPIAIPKKVPYRSRTLHVSMAVVDLATKYGLELSLSLDRDNLCRQWWTCTSTWTLHSKEMIERAWTLQSFWSWRRTSGIVIVVR